MTTAKPELSRRQLLTALVGGSKRLFSGTLFPPKPLKGVKSPPPERQRLIAALKQAGTPATADSEQLPFVMFATSEACTACGVCARVCPTGALQFILTPAEQYQLTFQSAACTDCGDCVDLCAPGALRRAGQAALADVLAEKPLVLSDGALRRCRRCGAKFAGAVDKSTCPVCEWRQRHPFGSRPLPEVRSMTRAGRIEMLPVA